MCTIVTIFSALLFTENSALVISVYTSAINEVEIERQYFELIYDSYLELNASIRDLELGSNEFNQALIGKNNTGRKPLSSRRSVEKLQEHFANRLQTESKINTFIVRNLPLNILNEIPNLTEKRIEQYFKRLLAKTIYPIIDQLEIDEFVKLSMIGFWISMFNYCDRFEQFSHRYMHKHNIHVKDNKAMISYYKEYLFDQAKNILK